MEINLACNVSLILKQMLLEHLNRRFEILPKKEIDWPLDSYNIGICIPSIFGIEAIGLLSNEHNVQINAVYFLPFKGQIYLSDNKNHIFIKEGCIIEDTHTIQPLIFKNPILAHRNIFIAYKNWEEPLRQDEVYELTQNKRKTYEFLKLNNIKTTDIQVFVDSEDEIENAINHVSDNGKQSIVVKEFDGYCGLNLKMFDNIIYNEVAQYAKDLLNNKGKILIERRVKSYPFYENKLRMDWLVRLHIIFDDNKNPIVITKTAFVTYKFYDSFPVNGYMGTKHLLDDVLNKLNIGENKKNEIHRNLINLNEKLGSCFIAHISNQNNISGIHRIPALLSMDLILDENLEWRVIEVNSGNEGELYLNLFYNNYDISILKDYIPKPDFQNSIAQCSISKNYHHISFDNIRSDYWGGLGYFLERINLKEAEKANEKYYLTNQNKRSYKIWQKSIDILRYKDIEPINIFDHTYETYQLIIKNMVTTDSIVSEQRIRRSFAYFAEKLPKKLKEYFIYNIRILIMENYALKVHIPDYLVNKKSLIIMGSTNDLNDMALIGLLAHLLSLSYYGFDKEILKGEKWLKADVKADELAKDWGFEKEITELRKIRPQKVPIDIQYDDIVLKYSVPNVEFLNNLNEILPELKRYPDNAKLIYTDKYSIVCNTEYLLRRKIERLVVLTKSHFEIYNLINAMSSLLSDL